MSIEQYRGGAEVALANVQDQAVHRLAEWAHSADAAYQVAQRLSDSAFVPQQFRGKPVETTAAILAGLEVGLQPMAALRSFDIIQGQAAPRAITLRAVVQAQGHEMVLVESTATRCRMKGKRKGSDEWQSVTWTIDRAKDLGLTGKSNWKQQPAAMLTARATSELARLIASDAILGIGYSSEEVADGGTYDQQVDEVTTTPAPQGTTRRMSRRPRTGDSEGSPAETPDAGGEAGSSPAGIPSESPLLDTTSQLAKAMYATINEAGIPEEERLEQVGQIIGREIASTKEMTEAEARQVLDHLNAQIHADQLPIDEVEA